MVEQAPEQPDSLTEDDYIELLERAAEKIQRLERQVKTYQTLVVLEGRSKKAKRQLGGKRSAKKYQLAYAVADRLYKKELKTDQEHPPGKAAGWIRANLMEHSDWFKAQSTDFQHEIPSEISLKKHLKEIAPPAALKPGRRKSK